MEVCWSPLHEDKFYSLGTNLNLYKVYQSQLPISNYEVQEKDMRLSDETQASLICTRNGLQCRSIAWRPHSDPDNLIAIGLNNGKVLLSSFGKGTISDPHGISGSEFTLKHHRPCTYLEWNKQEPFLLAEVTEKLKTDGCILIWDVCYPNNQSPLDNQKLTTHTAPNDPSSSSLNYSRPYMEIGVNESCSSFAWLHLNARSFVCGMNLKNLRIYDIRSPAEQSRPQHSTSTRAISLINVNPSSPHQLASVYENQLFLWDIRKFNEAYDTIVEKMNFARISWCPNKPGILACSFIDSPLLKLHDFSSSSPSENKERYKKERILRPTLSSSHDENICYFSWHPTHTCRLLVATTSGRISDFTANNRMAMAWSPDLSLTCSVNNEMFVGVAKCSELLDDMSIKIRKRAIRQYGIKSQTAQNIACVRGDSSLTSIWTWLSAIKPEHRPPPVQSPSTLEPPVLAISQSPFKNSTYTHLPTSESSTALHLPLSSITNHNHSLPQSPTVPHLSNLPPHPTTPGNHLHLGGQSSSFNQSINPLLFSSSNLAIRLSGLVNLFQRPPRTLQTTLVSLDWTSGQVVVSPTRDFLSYSGKAKNQVFKSPERLLALEMCGWKFPSESVNLPLVDRLKGEGNYSRAACISVFSIRLNKALAILRQGGTHQGPGEDLSMVAMALAGFLGNNNNNGGCWSDTCAQLNHTLHNPYLRALFSFLTSKDSVFESILNDTALELTDRTAFACLHLSDKMLLDFLERQTDKYMRDGNPEGLILTGFTDNGMQLLARYIDRTCDVQSAVVLLLQAMPEVEELRGSKQLEEWVEEYRELLDRMGLWMERAEFDVFRMRAKKTIEKTRQIHISCTFCNKPIVVDSRSTRARTTSTNVGGHVKPRIQSCPHCCKPLPRCSVCMLFMGTASGIGCPRNYKATLKQERKLSRIRDWFTWCQRCLHGGHAGHMMEWFKSRSVCPISGCNCRCDQLDAYSKRDLVSRDRGDGIDDNDVDNNANNNDDNCKNKNNNHKGDGVVV